MRSTSAAVLGALALVACGRVGFDPVGDAGSDGIVPIAGCDVPARPDTLGGTLVACDETSLRNAAAVGGPMDLGCMPGATITVSSEIVITLDTVLDARGARFDAQQLTRVFRVQSGTLTLLDAQLVNGQSTQNGGAILVEGGALVVYGSTFTGNRAPPAGGGALASSTTSTVAIYDSTFADNSAVSGGAIEAHGDLSIARSSLTSNAATTGVGGALNASGSGDLTLCGVTFSDNSAGDFSGAIHRVAIDDAGIDRWEKVRIVSNRANGAGAAYIQGTSMVLRQVSIAGNLGSSVGGLWFSIRNDLQAENVTIIDNELTTGLGAGLRLENTTGRIGFSTIANNHAACATCYAAIEGGQGVTLADSVIANNLADATSLPASCRLALLDGGGNFQWPTETPLCAAGATIADPLLSATVAATGPAGTYDVRVPQSGSPVIRTATSCPAEDALGNPRPMPCAAGSVEP